MGTSHGSLSRCHTRSWCPTVISFHLGCPKGREGMGFHEMLPPTHGTSSLSTFCRTTGRWHRAVGGSRWSPGVCPRNIGKGLFLKSVIVFKASTSPFAFTEKIQRSACSSYTSSLLCTACTIAFEEKYWQYRTTLYNHLARSLLLALFLHLSHLTDSKLGPFRTAFPRHTAPEGQKATFRSRWHLWQTRSFCRQTNPSPSSATGSAISWPVFFSQEKTASHFGRILACPCCPTAGKDCLHPREKVAAESRRIRNDFHVSINKYLVSS